MKLPEISKEMIDEIIGFYNAGKSLTALSYMYRFSTDVIKQLLENNNVKIREPRNRKNPAKPKLIEEFKSGKTVADAQSLCEKYGVTRDYIASLFCIWNKENSGIEPPKKTYWSVNCMAKLRDELPVDTELYMPIPVDYSTYSFGAVDSKLEKVTVIKKYPNFAITNKGTRMWQEIFDAIRRYPENQRIKDEFKEILRGDVL